MAAVLHPQMNSLLTSKNCPVGVHFRRSYPALAAFRPGGNSVQRINYVTVTSNKTTLQDVEIMITSQWIDPLEIDSFGRGFLGVYTRIAGKPFQCPAPGCNEIPTVVILD